MAHDASYIAPHSTWKKKKKFEKMPWWGTGCCNTLDPHKLWLHVYVIAELMHLRKFRIFVLFLHFHAEELLFKANTWILSKTEQIWDRGQLHEIRKTNLQ